MLGFITKWFDKIAHSLELRIQLIKLNLMERISGILSYFIFSFVVLFITLAILIFMGMGLSELFATLTGSRTAGYFITTGIYILLLAIIMAVRKSFIKSFSGVFIRIMTAEDGEDDYPSVENKNIREEE
jgi:hypothetical protein